MHEMKIYHCVRQYPTKECGDKQNVHFTINKMVEMMGGKHSSSHPRKRDKKYLSSSHVQLRWFQRLAGFLHHNQFFDVIIETSDRDIKKI